IEQVRANLLGNAIKYSPRGGAIDVEVAAPAPETVRLAVRDHGQGIPESRRERIFDRFYQAGHGNHSEGMGLGLYLCRQIVEQHGGQIGMVSPPDDEGGTRFTVTLPRSRPN